MTFLPLLRLSEILEILAGSRSPFLLSMYKAQGEEGIGFVEPTRILLVNG